MVPDIALRRAIESVQQLSEPSPPWQDILREARAVVGGESACFLIFEGRQVVSLEQIGVDPAAEADYIRHWHPQDILLRPGVVRPSGSWLDTQQVLSPQELRRNAYYVDFMCKHRLRQTFALVVEDGPNRTAAMSFQRETPTAGNETLESPAVAAYARALQKALDRRRQSAAHWLQSVDMAFDSFGEAASLVSAQAAVLWCSNGFDELLGEPPLLTVRDGRFWHPSPRVHEMLLESIRRASQTPLPLRLAVPAGPGASLGVELTQAPELLAWNREPAVLVRLRRHRDRALAPETLRMAFDLSVAESKVLAAMAAGRTPGEYAEENALSVHTVRKHIANLMSKMRCTRHSDAIRMAVSVSAD
ncbi:Transcriptional regulator, LuxR family [Burkholderiales bacterium 8X]|nr:Transcriptional regulator, LuxR family [Burkholderiales bacterium 8X]